MRAHFIGAILLIAMQAGALRLRAAGMESGPAKDQVYWYPALIDPKTVSDALGKRIAQRFIAIEVTVANENRDLQYLIKNISINYRKLLKPEEAAKCIHPQFGLDLCEVSSQQLGLLRGVAEKGEAYDRRNIILRVLQGTGTIAGGLTGVPIRGITYSRSVAIFNGPFVSSFRNVFPDFTTNQGNRLSDAAYQPNVLIGRGQSKAVVAFLPQSLFLNKHERGDYWKDPMALLATKDIQRDLVIRVAGTHVVETDDIAPAGNAAMSIDAANHLQFAAKTPAVSGHISGQFLKGGQLSIVRPEGVSIEQAGSQTDSRLDFILRATHPLERGTAIEYRISKAAGDVTATYTVPDYSIPAPVLDSITPDSAPKDQEVEVKLSGRNLIPGRTEVIAPAGVQVTIDEGKSTFDVLTAKVKATGEGTQKLRVRTPGGESAEKDLRVQ